MSASGEEPAVFEPGIVGFRYSLVVRAVHGFNRPIFQEVGQRNKHIAVSIGTE